MQTDLHDIQYHFIGVDDLSSAAELLWRKTLAGTQPTSVFHSVEWCRLLFDEFGAVTRAAIALVDSKPVGLFCYHCDRNWHFFRKNVSPYGELESPYGGPLVEPGYEWTIAPLLHAVQIHEKTISSWIVGTPSFDAKWLKEAGFDTLPLYTSIVKLGRSEDDLWAGIHQKTRNMIRKAQKEQVEIRESNGDHVALYYSMLQEVLGRHDHPLLPQSFYQRIVRDLAPIGMARFTLAWHCEQAVAGLIALSFKDTIYYWSGASHLNSRAAAPNDILQWDMITWANAHGFKYYDLLRIEPDRLPGIAKFKMRFGGETVALPAGAQWTGGGQLIRGLQFVTDPQRMLRRLRKFRGAPEQTAAK